MSELFQTLFAGMSVGVAFLVLSFFVTLTSEILLALFERLANARGSA